MSVSAEKQIRQAIRDEGKITFARFMELALYAPGAGYYSGRRAEGRESDYVTAPVTHPVFGALLSLQLEQMWELLERPGRFTVVEPGAGSGALARDILRYAQAQQPEFACCLDYLALELSVPPPALPLQPQWAVAATLPLRGVVGCILANEFLDAFPVHRFVVQEEQLLEVYVTLREDRLVEEIGQPSTPALQDRIQDLGVVLPAGFQGEVNLSIGWWMEEVARALERGFVLTIDYGGRAEEVYAPRRGGSTLRSYYRHTLSASPYQRVGQQDLTAHVDFTHVVEEGRKQGLEPQGYTTQRQFLRNLGLDAFLKALRRRTRRQRERYTNQMAIRELVRPDGMGDFKVLAQGKGVPDARLYGFSPVGALHQRLHAQLDTMELPEPTADHARILEAKYPHLAYDFQDQWPG